MKKSSKICRITVHLWTGEDVAVDIQQEWNILELKQHIEGCFSIPVSVQHFGVAIDKPEWSNELSLQNCGILESASALLWWHLRVHKSPALLSRSCTPSSSPMEVSLMASATASLTSLFVFDLDDTLTKNGIMPLATKRCLAELAQTQRLAIASFNLCAVEFLQRNGVLDLFEVVVCGYYDGVRKTDHFAKVLSVMEWPLLGTPRRGYVYFFDDQIVNVEDIRRAFPGTVSIHVQSLESVPALIGSLMSISRQPMSLAPLKEMSAERKPMLMSQELFDMQDNKASNFFLNTVARVGAAAAISSESLPLPLRQDLISAEISLE